MQLLSRVRALKAAGLGRRQIAAVLDVEPADVAAIAGGESVNVLPLTVGTPVPMADILTDPENDQVGDATTVWADVNKLRAPDDGRLYHFSGYVWLRPGDTFQLACVRDEAHWEEHLVAIAEDMKAQSMTLRSHASSEVPFQQLWAFFVVPPGWYIAATTTNPSSQMYAGDCTMTPISD